MSSSKLCVEILAIHKSAIFKALIADLLWRVKRDFARRMSLNKKRELISWEFIFSGPVNYSREPNDLFQWISVRMALMALEIRRIKFRLLKLSAT